MRVMLIFFSSVEPGGINSVTLGLLDGFKKAGHLADYFHLTPKGKLRKLDKNYIIGKRYLRVQGEQFGYEDPIQIARYRRVVETYYDAVIFVLPCPHHTKSSGGDDRSWQELYKVSKPVFCIFHDSSYLSHPISSHNASMTAFLRIPL